MTTINTQIEINAPVERVFEFYTNPDNIKESWPHDIVKESENVSGQKSEEGSEMKVEGQYLGKSEEMILEVTQKEQNKQKVHFKDGIVYKNFKAVEMVLLQELVIL